MKNLLLRAVFLAAVPALTLRQPAAGSPDKPSTPAQVWAGFDPRSEPLEVEVLRRWSEEGADWREFYFTGMRRGGDTVRAYAMYAAPTGGTKLPAVMHIHGGGQTAVAVWLKYWTHRGYAALSYDFCGEMAGREKFTRWGSVTHGNQAQAGTKLMAADPTVRESSWYLWTALARRALTALEQQPEVDAARLGIFGVSIGGTITWPVAAMDTRVKAACAIYGAGWTTWPEKSDAPDSGAADAAMTYWRTVMEAESYAPLVRCPLLFLNATNDHHGKMDFAFRSLARLPGAWRQVHTPRYRHHIGPGQENDLPLWMDWWLKDGAAWPATPAAALSLDPAGAPQLTVTPDPVRRPAKVEIFYAVENSAPVNRFWRTVAAVEKDGRWLAALPVLQTTVPLYAFANVSYEGGLCLGSTLLTAVPDKLGGARATDRTSLMIDDFRDGVADWVTHSPATDPIPPMPSLIRAVTGPDKKAAVTVAQPVALLTHKIGDPKWSGPPGAALCFDIFTSISCRLTVSVHEKEFTVGQRHFDATAPLTAAPGWQSIALTPRDFHLTGDPAAAPDWQLVRLLEITSLPASETMPFYTNFHWRPAAK